MKYTFLIVFYLFTGYASNAGNRDLRDKRDSVLCDKLFYFLKMLNSKSGIKQEIASNAQLQKITFSQSGRVEKVLKKCKDGRCYSNALRWDSVEILKSGNELVKILKNKKAFIKDLRQSQRYSIFNKLPDTSLIRKAWEHSAYGINRIFDVYLGGYKPKRYAAIDSISFRYNDLKFIQKADSALSFLTSNVKRSPAFYSFPLEASLAILEINGRDEAARYEPLTEGYNAAAFNKVKLVNWEQYKYSIILVPGFGPEKEGVKLHEKGIQRCKMAAERYKKGLAPFLIVSGGQVYPFRTPFSEAVEMRRYLIEELGIPEAAIIIEPHARHTTTNIRNASRLIYRFGVPESKPGLVVTDKEQTQMIAKLDERCIRELGYVPYKNVKPLNDNEIEFYPTKDVFQINVDDSLDP